MLIQLSTTPMISSQSCAPSLNRTWRTVKSPKKITMGPNQTSTTSQEEHMDLPPPPPPPQPGSQRSRDQFVSTTPPPNYNGCVFCGSRNHYSALCMRTPKLSERAMSLVRAGRCLKCISRHEPGQCKRRSWCLTCHSYTHHQALCGQGDVIINDVEGPLQEYYDMMSRLSECSYTSYRSRKRARLDREG